MSDSPSTRTRARAFAVAFGLGVLGIGLGVALAFGAVRVLTRVGVELSTGALVLVSLFVVQGVAFGGLSWLYWRYRGEWVLDLFSRPDLRDVLVAVGAYGLALGGAVVGAVVITALELRAGRNTAASAGVESPEILLVLVVASFVLIGPGEEVLFRGVVQRRLRESFGPTVAVVAAAGIFASVHVVSLSGELGARAVTIGVLLLPSVAFGAAYEYTDNLTVPALVHGAYNATLFSVLYLVLKLAELGYAPTPA
jgi:hypothetical protein